jgi:hypothetical protein
MAAVKRLLRDLFSEQLAIKGRLITLEADADDPAGEPSTHMTGIYQNGCALLCLYTKPRCM